MRLHHNPISTCSQKVRLVLSEKQLDVEHALVDLQRGEQFAPWIAGDTFSLADALAPYVLRADHLMLTGLIDARPHLARWYHSVLARHWESAVTRWLPDTVVEAFRNAGQAAGHAPGHSHRSELTITAPSKQGNPELATMLKVLRAPGIRLRAEAITN